MDPSYSTPKVFAAACAGMAFFGVAMLSLGPILGPLNEIVPGANALPSTMSLGIILGTLLFGPVVDRSGYKWLLIISSVLALGGLAGLSLSKNIAVLHGAIFCLGVGGGILNGETNALVSDIYDEERRGGRLGILGAFYCIGALLWTLLNYFIPDYRIPLTVMAAIMALLTVWFCFLSFPKAKPSAKEMPLVQSLGLLKYPALLLFGLILFFQSGFEGASGNFTVSYLEHTSSISHAAATLAMTWFTIGMLCGRLPLGHIIRRLREAKTLYCYLGVALAGVLLLYLGGGRLFWVYLSMVLIGFGVGATFPVVLNFLGGAFPERSGTAFSLAIFIALLGQTTLNRLTGVAFDAGNYRFLPLALGVAIVMMRVLLPVARKAGDKIKNQPLNQ